MDRTELSFINLINLQLTYDRPDLVSARKTTKNQKLEVEREYLAKKNTVYKYKNTKILKHTILQEQDRRV